MLLNTINFIDSVTFQSDMSPRLKVEIYHTTVASHQESAIICLTLLKELAEKTPAFRRIISQALVDDSHRGGGQTVLDKFFLNDNFLWISKLLQWTFTNPKPC